MLFTLTIDQHRRLELKRRSLKSVYVSLSQARLWRVTDLKDHAAAIEKVTIKRLLPLTDFNETRPAIEKGLLNSS